MGTKLCLGGQQLGAKLRKTQGDRSMHTEIELSNELMQQIEKSIYGTYVPVIGMNDNSIEKRIGC